MAEWKYSRVDTSDNLTTIESVACLVKGVYINSTLSNHVVEIMDDTSKVFTIPAGATAGNAYDFDTTRFEDKLIVDPDDSSTGSITIMYNIMGEAHG